MNDAIALLAISQLVCLGAMFYLYTQLQEMRKRRPARRQHSPRVRDLNTTAEVPGRHSAGQAARSAYGSKRPMVTPVPRMPAGTLAVRLGDAGLDVPALARRMQKSEEEVRLLLRRQGLAQG
jgi:hypothetical protein